MVALAVALPRQRGQQSVIARPRRPGSALRERLAAGITDSIVDVMVNGTAPVSPAVLNVTFTGCRADDLLLMLDAAGLDCSTGSACTAGVHQPSEVLLAMGRSEAEASSSLRFSFDPRPTTRRSTG